MSAAMRLALGLCVILLIPGVAEAKRKHRPKKAVASAKHKHGARAAPVAAAPMRSPAPAAQTSAPPRTTSVAVAQAEDNEVPFRRPLNH
jgi:hypothetical protein